MGNAKKLSKQKYTTRVQQKQKHLKDIHWNSGSDFFFSCWTAVRLSSNNDGSPCSDMGTCCPFQLPKSWRKHQSLNTNHTTLYSGPFLIFGISSNKPILLKPKILQLQKRFLSLHIGEWFPTGDTLADFIYDWDLIVFQAAVQVCSLCSGRTYNNNLEHSSISHSPQLPNCSN